MAVPGVQNNQGMLHPDFRSKFPLGTIPAIEDTGNGLKLSESTAILTYLAEKHGWQDIYPPDAAIRAKVNEYMSWHHSGTRNLHAGLFAPKVRLDIKHDPSSVAAAHGLALHSLSVIDSVFLGNGPFIAGLERPSAADFLCYSEVAQVGPRFGNLVCLDSYPRVERWMGTMAALPHHDAVFAANEALGDLRPGHRGVPILQRLDPAVKIVVAAL